MVVDLIDLYAQGEVSGGVPVHATAEAVEGGPTNFVAGRGQSLHDEGGDRIAGVRSGYFANGAEVGTNEDGDGNIVADGQFRAVLSPGNTYTS